MNDSSVTLAAMAAVVGGLLSFAGQHEYRRLLDPGYQLAVLDQWAGAETLRLAAEYRTSYEQAAGLRAGAGREQAGPAGTDSARWTCCDSRSAELAAAQLSVLDEERRCRRNSESSPSAEEIQRDLGRAAELLKGEGAAADASGLVGQAVTLVGGLTRWIPRSRPWRRRYGRPSYSAH